MKRFSVFYFAAVFKIIMIVALSISPANAETESLSTLKVDDYVIKSMQERADYIDAMTEKRIHALLPTLMADSNIDMWILISREYNEDPILKTMLPATWLSARRTTILVLAREGESVNTYAVAPYKVGNTFGKAWDKTEEKDQWQALVKLIEKHEPKSIGLNQSKHWAHADGLVASDKEVLLSNLPTKYKEKIVSAEPLAVAWLEQRLPEELDQFKKLVGLAQAIIAEGFSNKTITVGETTTEDLVWWFRERVASLKLQTWFHPSVSIQRMNESKFDHESSFTDGYGSKTVLSGDLLHVDFGLTYLRLNTDTQQHAYVLRKGEIDAPQYLKDALTKGNQLQDIFTNRFQVGRTGNQVLKASREEAIAAGLNPTIYTHPLGYHGHAAGTTLGMWDSQGGVPGSGDYPLHLNTAYSIELNNAVFLKEWDKEIRIMLEEDAFFDKTGVWYLHGRQEKFHLIQSK